MGISMFGRCQSSPYAAPESNPNPCSFTIIKECVIVKGNNEFLILKVNYPDCKNFEGDKIMVYFGFNSSERLLKQSKGKLDPHFSKEHTSPVMRFNPAMEWTTIIDIVNTLNA